MRPGVHEHEVVAIADKVLDENGIVEGWFSTIVASGPRADLTGHLVDGFYKPVIVDFIDYSLEPNMTFAYKPVAYIPSKGCVCIEPYILITQNSHEMLTEFHKTHMA